MKTKRYYETPAMQVHNLSKFVPIICISAPRQNPEDIEF